jgi:hypothetical protein
MDPFAASLMSTVIRFAASTATAAEVGAGLRVLAERAQRDDAFWQELGLLAREETGSRTGELRDCVMYWCARTANCEDESATGLFADAVVAAARIENSSLGNRNARRLRDQPTTSDIAAFRGRWDQLVDTAEGCDKPPTKDEHEVLDARPQAMRDLPAEQKRSREIDLRAPRDRGALDECELYAEVIAAVEASEGPLTKDELDEILGLRGKSHVANQAAAS